MLWAWVLLGEAVTATQAVGGVVVLLGLALARQGDRSADVTAATWPDVGPVEGAPPASARQTSGMKLAAICNICL